MDHSQTLAQLIGGIVTGGIRVIDLTVPLESGTPVIKLPPQFAPSKSFSLEEISRYDSRGPAWYWNNISCGEHTGTHFDAPIHWVTGKDYPENATHNIPVDRFIGPACVIDVARQARENADFLVTTDLVEAWEKKHGRIPAHAWVLIRTDWSKRKGADAYLNIAADGTNLKASASFRGRALLVITGGRKIKIEGLSLDGNRDRIGQPSGPAPADADKETIGNTSAETTTTIMASNA